LIYLEMAKMQAHTIQWFFVRPKYLIKQRLFFELGYLCLHYTLYIWLNFLLKNLFPAK
jgi:hypothetical protein